VARALLALLLAAVLTSAQARDPLQAIDACVAKLDSALDVGYARIAARCPELTPALKQSPWAAWLPADWDRPDNQLSAAGLGELRALLARASSLETPRRAALRTGQVGAVLAAVTRADSAAGSWWERFRGWLRSILAARSRTDGDWLRRLLAELNLSAQTTEVIAWGAFAVVVALAAAIVISELRVAGLLGGRTQRVRAVDKRAGARGVVSLEAIERAAPPERPALLLELIAARLVELERLPPARALTARELSGRAQLPDDAGRGQLAELVAVSERVRFADQAVAAVELDSALRGGRSLLVMLAAPSAAAPALP
jgi:hypothetical protein